MFSILNWLNGWVMKKHIEELLDECERTGERCTSGGTTCGRMNGLILSKDIYTNKLSFDIPGFSDLVKMRIISRKVPEYREFENVVRVYSPAYFAYRNECMFISDDKANLCSMVSCFDDQSEAAFAADALMGFGLLCLGAGCILSQHLVN